MDEELAMRLHEEEKAELEIMQRERATKEEASNAALTIEFDDVQARIDADALLAARLQEEEREQFSIDEQARILVETIAERKSRKKDDDSQKQAESSKKRPEAEHDEESVKKQKLEDDAEKEEFRACLDIVPRDDIVINVESLATKYPIIFSEMLDDFDRQDVVDLYSLAKETYEILSPEGYDRLPWGDLITLFESIYVLLMDTGIAIHMMVEKKYPLTQEMLSRMLNRRLEVDYESTMAFELIRFIKAQLDK
ncbi:hypothetical protein Tco_0382887 [Tanacetum coccineum]